MSETSVFECFDKDAWVTGYLTASPKQHSQDGSGTTLARDATSSSSSGRSTPSTSSRSNAPSHENLWVDFSCEVKSPVAAVFREGLLRHTISVDGLSRRCSSKSDPRLSTIHEAVGFAKSSIGQGSELGAVFTLICSAMGAGCLSLPHMMKQSGIGLGLLLLMIGACMAHVSMVVLMSSARYTRSKSFAALVELASRNHSRDNGFLGAHTQLAVDGVIAAYSIAAMLCYMMFIADFLGGIVASPECGNWNLSRSTLVFGSLFVVFPLSVPRQVTALRYVCLLSTASVALTAIVVAAKTPGLYGSVDAVASGDNDIRWWVGDFRTTLNSLVIAIFAFAAHTNAVPVVASLSDPSPERIWRVSLTSVMIELVVYMLLGICGYLSFRDDTMQDFIRNYPTDDRTMFAIRCLYSITVILGVPINLSPAAASLQTLARKVLHFKFTRKTLVAGQPENEQSKAALHVVIVAVVLGICAVLAAASEDIADVIALLGGSFGTLICLWWPSRIYRSVLGQLHSRTLSTVISSSLTLAATFGALAFLAQAREALSR